MKFAMQPMIRLIGSDGAGIMAEIIQQSRYASGSSELRSIPKHSRKLIIGAAPKGSVDEEMLR